MHVERRSFLASLWAGLSVVIWGREAPTPKGFDTLRAFMEEPVKVETSISNSRAVIYNGALSPNCHGIALEDSTPIYSQDGTTLIGHNVKVQITGLTPSGIMH